MKHPAKMLISILLILAGIAAFYVGGNMLYGTLTDYKPAPAEPVEIKNPVAAQPADSVFTCMIWNIGYSGLGAQEDFFFDGGTMVRPSQTRVEENLKGIRETIAAKTGVDFILLQEVDENSKRSYYNNEVEEIAKALPDYSYGFALNYNVKYVPAPLDRPWNAMGKVRSGLASYSRFAPVEATRIAFPGGFAWPKRVFWLDRCLLVFRYNLPGGKQLLVINTHNEAYDEGGFVKKKEMEVLRDLLTQEYAKGNYIIIGGDWNQCPPNFDYQHFGKDEDGSYVQLNVPADFMPEGWTWAYDPGTPTNRKLAKPFVKGETFVTLIDFFLVSPNVKILEVKGVSVDFGYSDHQPVTMKVKLE